MSEYLIKIVQLNKDIKFSSYESLVRKLIDNNSLITFVNPYSFKMLSKNIKILEGYDYIFFDGISLIIISYLITGINVPRLSFDMTSLAPHLFEYLSKTNQTVYLIGSKVEHIKLAKNKLQNKFKHLNVIGSSSGYFKNDRDRKNILNEIKKLSPEIVIVGMGTPKQEHFLLELRKSGWQGTGFTCGAFFEQTAENINYYPNLINKLNLRWLYRLIKNPLLFRRYLIDYPIQIIRIIRT